MSRIKLNLKRINPVKAGVINGLLMAVIALVALIPMFMFMSALGATDNGLMFGGGITMLIFGPIIYGIIGFIFGLIGTVLLNFILDKTKGLDIEFESNNIEISQSSNEEEVNY
ncbi:MAG: hypothetical protein L3J23_03630 [Flavobacteriaceae bacterium]|nr:hypothetical protein [Flavobacteriaceae bacterium]